MAKIAAICISDVRGIQKHEIPEAFLKKDWGIEGDAHAGNWHRQVSLLSVDSVAKLQENSALSSSTVRLPRISLLRAWRCTRCLSAQSCV